MKCRSMRLVVLTSLALGAVGCTPGYIKPSELEARGQGPTECAKSCEALNMRMAALVLVGDSLPGCVCQPLPVQGAPAPAPQSSLSEEGAAASTTGYVIIAAAVAREQQRQQQLRQQQLHQQRPKY